MKLYCPKCRTARLNFDGLKEYRCPACRFRFFHNAATAVGALIVQHDHLLVGVRAREPGRGLLDIPGGFVDPGENAETALTRELEEELSLSPEQLHYFCSAANRYFYDGLLYRTCDLYFLCVVESFTPLAAGDDLAEYLWLPLDAVDAERFAFESAREAVATLKRDLFSHA